MEAAMNVARRGHDVTLLEKQDRAGGEAWLAGAAPLRRKYKEIAEFYDDQARRGLFDLRLGVDASVENLLQLAPDVVVVATGSKPVRGGVPGDDEIGLFTVHDVLDGEADERKHVLILDRTGEAPAFVAADYLSAIGVKVEFVAATPELGQEMGELDLAGLYGQMEGQGVSFRAGLDALRIDAGRVVMGDVFSGKELVLGPFDGIVIAAGSEPVQSLARELQGKVGELHVIGSAKAPGSIMTATVDGARLGRSI